MGAPGVTGLRLAVLAVLALSPLPFGSVLPGAVLALELSAAVLGCWTLWIVARDRDALPPRARRLLVPAGVVVAIGLLQLVPVPRDVLRHLAPLASGARDQVGGLVGAPPSLGYPVSFEPPATVDALLRFVAYLMIGLAAAVSLREARHLRQAAALIAAFGAIQAVYGCAEYLSGHQHIFGYAKIWFLEEATGTFINRNHFAGYLAMTLPFALGSVVDRLRRLPHAGSLRERVVAVAPAETIGLVLAVLAVSAIWSGIVLSYSRAGLAVSLVAFVVVALLATDRRRVRAVLLVSLLLPTAFLLWQEIRAPGERFAETETLASLGGRIPVWRTALPIAASHPVLGTGLGTFEPVFQGRQPPTIHGRWDHAHNDWLEALLEGGVGVAVAMALMMILALRSSPGGSFLRVSASAAIVAFAVHAATDFPSRIPATAVLLAVSVGFRCAADRRAVPGPNAIPLPAERC